MIKRASFKENRVVAVDVETTGLSPYRGGRVIEVAAVMIVDCLIEDYYSCLINVNAPIPSAAHRISME